MIAICNDIPISPMFQEDDAKRVYDDILLVGESAPHHSFASSGKRSNHSFSMGLQTMYAHEQHTSRYGMLSHSSPHVPSVKKIPNAIFESIMNVYNRVQKLLEERLDYKTHPFKTQEGDVVSFHEVLERLKLRNGLLTHIKGKGISLKNTWPSNETMFEACTVQPTDALGFHKDLMNCTSMDKTIAFLAPFANESTPHGTIEEENCLTFLFYSRKCVGDHATKISKMELYGEDKNSCDLTVLCLRSIMHVGGIYDYQGSLFEANESMTTIASILESDANHSCLEIKDFTGLSCFKHGAAFDKMGYYSIVPNVFLSLYYQDIIVTTDDAISLCMFFGLLCNGTSALAAVWNTTYENVKPVKKWLEKRTHASKLFECLVYKLYGKRFSQNSKNGSILYGNSKLPRFQYAPQTTMIIYKAEDIHRIVKEFMRWRTCGDGRTKRVNTQQQFLYKKVKKFKGIGPISFNQLWHSLCLCGILPLSYIQQSMIGPSSGPAKLIQTFYPYLKTAGGLQKKLGAVRQNLSNLGLTKVTDFLVENMMCELWRIINKLRILKKGMTTAEKVDTLLSKDIQCHIENSAKTSQPDIYYRNPFTDEQQHLFRVLDKDLIMRPSFMDNKLTGSVNMQCSILCDAEQGTIVVKWNGEVINGLEQHPSTFFT